MDTSTILGTNSLLDTSSILAANSMLAANSILAATNCCSSKNSGTQAVTLLDLHACYLWLWAGGGWIDSSETI